MNAAGTTHARRFGVLLHPSSLPGREDIGTLGTEAVAFVEWLAAAGASIWQTLPLTMNGKNESPYFSPSAFAGNPWLIDLEVLRVAGLLDEVERNDRVTDARVPFDAMRRRKRPQLWAAADRLLSMPQHPWRSDFDRFVREADWLAPTCHFFALKELHDGAPWWEWPEGLRRRDERALERSRQDLALEIDRRAAVLFLFEMQWRAVRADANRHGIAVLGDLPIYVSDDSADVWSHQDQFELDEDGRLTVQSGAPPDYFSADGQLWRNPLYRWDVMAEDGFSWWISRLRRALELSDIVRIDHFRALSAYWEVPADAENAIGGRWVPGPGQDFLDAVRAAFPAMPFVAEDLGTLDDDVHTLRDSNGLPGMRILQFGFDGMPDNPHLPGAIPAASLVYTGTHDNNTLAAWWTELDPGLRAHVAATYQIPAGAGAGRAVWSFVEAAVASPAVGAVFPMQDLLVLDDRARMNVPSTTSGNWDWRMPPDALSPDLAASLRRLGERYGRC